MCQLHNQQKHFAAGKAEFRAIHIINLGLEMLKSSVTAVFNNCSAGGILFINCTFIKMDSELNLGLTERSQEI